MDTRQWRADRRLLRSAETAPCDQLHDTRRAKRGQAQQAGTDLDRAASRQSPSGANQPSLRTTRSHQQMRHVAATPPRTATPRSQDHDPASRPWPGDVLIKIAYVGICHSDIHAARGEWGEAIFPLVPGHEIAGTVEEIGTGSPSTRSVTESASGAWSTPAASARTAWPARSSTA